MSIPVDRLLAIEAMQHVWVRCLDAGKAGKGLRAPGEVGLRGAGEWEPRNAEAARVPR